MDKGHITALLCAAATTMSFAPCHGARAQFLAGGRVDGVEAAEALSATDRGTLVPMGSSIAVRVRGSGRCNLAFEVNRRRVHSASLIGLPGVVSIPYALNEQMRQRAETVHVSTEQPCLGDGTVPLLAGGELTRALIQTPAVNVGMPVEIALGGRGLCESVMLRDSRSGAMSERTPQIVRGRTSTSPSVWMTASKPGVDTVTVLPGKLCAGSLQRFVMTVANPDAATILGISAAGSSSVGAPLSMSIVGKGSGCEAVMVSFGDGNTATLSGAFPLTTQHAYSNPGHFKIVASPPPFQKEGPGACTGTASGVVDVGVAKVTIVAISASPKAAVEQPVPIRVNTAGLSCSAVQVDFGDGTNTSAGAPLELNHRYGKAGTYAVTVTGTNECQGGGRATVVVAARPRSAASDQAEVDKGPRGGKPAVKGGKP